ncbi:hypothetical protein F2Q70_00039491 [Brassica cretica]|uniref:Uncharacterized protein n=1 Tax=Brassica cretica TaxID=69181 RepID=A0A8S9K0N5_BRACR|nr:hypothetical protein F2Q70_00039491 [Brassica cretica]
MNPKPLSFLSSLVGGRAKPRRPFTNRFSSPVPSWGNVPEADSEAVPMAPLRRLRFCFFGDGPRSEIREGDLFNIRRKYLIHLSMGMRSPTEFKRAPDGGAGEVAVYETYLEADFRGVIPSLIEEVSFFFGFSPSQLTPLTWRTLMALQVLGELHGFSIGVHEILYSYYFAHMANKDGFYHLRSRDSAPLVEEPLRGVRGNHPFGDGWNSRYVFVKIQEPVGYPMSWRTVDVSHPISFAGGEVAKLIMGISSDSARTLSCFVSHDVHTFCSREHDAHRRLTSEALLLRGQVQDMMACRDLLVQQVRASARWGLMKEWREKCLDHWNPEEVSSSPVLIWRALYSPLFDFMNNDASCFTLLLLAVTSLMLHEDPGIIGEGGPRAPLRSLDCVWDPEVPVRSRGLLSEARRSGDRGWNPGVTMILTRRYLDPENRIRPLRPCWNPEIWVRRSLFGTRMFFEVVMTPMHPRLHRVTVLRLPRQDYYWYLFGFRILPLGSWPRSCSYDVFYFCRKSLTGLECAGVGIVTQVPGLRCFPRQEKQDLDCSLYITVLLQ